MLAHRRRQWANIEPTLGEYLVFGVLSWNTCRNDAVNIYYAITQSMTKAHGILHNTTLNMNAPEKNPWYWRINGSNTCVTLNPYSVGTASDSDVCRRQILKSKVGPRAVRLNIFIMVVDP